MSRVPQPLLHTAIVENGFLDEFRRAQANLQANIAAGRGNTFAYTGIAGTSPLPTYLAYFTGRPDSAAGSTASYTGTLWTNSTFVNPLATFNPQPSGAADSLDADAVRRQNALTAGLPANFLVANPDLLGGRSSRATAATRSTTACRWSCASVCRTGSSSRLVFQGAGRWFCQRPAFFYG